MTTRLTAPPAAVPAPPITQAAILARIDVIERETAAALLHGAVDGAEYQAISNILARHHAEAMVPSRA